MKDNVQRIFNITSSEDFELLALEIFRYQSVNLPVYKEYLNIRKINPELINSIDKIPFLPIQLFKTRDIIANDKKSKVVFTSSGTTGAETSRHLVADTEVYINSFLGAFKAFYGEPSGYCILALLPSYLERKGSSLVYMVDHLIKQTNNPMSGFYLNEFDDLYEKILILESREQKTLLLGVSFALLDFATRYKITLKNTLVMETGGMKGKRQELTREELHDILCNSFGVSTIHSEYGMTELLSQAYSRGKGLFSSPPWMKVLIRDPYDPLALIPDGRSGAINIIDLANIYSCSFIQTDDLGRKFSDGTFEVLGRMEGAQLRGCNLLIYN